MTIALSRRSLIVGMGASLLLAPAVIRASANLMPISAKNLPRFGYVRAFGPDAGTIETIQGQAPSWGIPADGRMIRGIDYPELYRSVRGVDARNDDDWVHLYRVGVDYGCEEHPPHGQQLTFDQFKTVGCMAPIHAIGQTL